MHYIYNTYNIHNIYNIYNIHNIYVSRFAKNGKRVAIFGHAWRNRRHHKVDIQRLRVLSVELIRQKAISEVQDGQLIYVRI